jgi:hypothetical protein
MMRPIPFFLGLSMMCSSCSVQDVEDLNLAELRKNCCEEITSSFHRAKVEDFRILAWYRQRDSRPWYADNALCWAEVATDKERRWLLVHMAKNPIKGLRDDQRQWHKRFVDDAPNRWFLVFDKPPTVQDVDRMVWFHFREESGWTTYDSTIDEKAWVAAFGHKPDRQFGGQLER